MVVTMAKKKASAAGNQQHYAPRHGNLLPQQHLQEEKDSTTTPQKALPHQKEETYSDYVHYEFDCHASFRNEET